MHQLPHGKKNRNPTTCIYSWDCLRRLPQGFIIWHKERHFLGETTSNSQVGILPARVANHGAESGSTWPLFGAFHLLNFVINNWLNAAGKTNYDICQLINSPLFLNSRHNVKARSIICFRVLPAPWPRMNCFGCRQYSQTKHKCLLWS